MVSNINYAIGGLSFALVIVFLIAILLFFMLFNTPQTHDIKMVNNTGEFVNVLIAQYTNTEKTTWKGLSQNIPPGQSFIFRATPGFDGFIEGISSSDTCTENCPRTRVFLQLAGDGAGNVYLYKGNEILGPITVINPVNTDIYGVSVQNGYTLPVTIFPTEFFVRKSSDTSSCRGPQWINTVNCPSALSVTGTTYCKSSCESFGTDDYCCTNFNCSGTATCQSSWNNKSFYTAFSNACVNCLITNCDIPKFTCNSGNGGLSTYTVTFGATIG